MRMICSISALVGAARWTSTITQQALTESTFLDYIRFQVDRDPPPAAQSVNRRVGTAERAGGVSFQKLRSVCTRLSELVLAAITAWRGATPGADSVAVKTPKRLIEPLSVDDVARFGPAAPRVTWPSSVDVTAWPAVMRSPCTQPRGHPLSGFADPGAGQAKIRMLPLIAIP
jgi:hypothetical protein